MNTLSKLLLLALLAAAPSQAAVIWDYSPAGLTLTTGSWSNASTGQNFADIVSFPTGAEITGYDHYTRSFLALDTVFQLKLLANNGGTPGTLLEEFNLTPDAAVLDGTYHGSFFDQDEDIYRYSFTFPAIVLAPGVSYWIGMSGATVGQAGVQAPGDSQMAQFDGASFAYITGTYVGDQSFRLSGELGDFTGVPEPGSLALLGLGFLGILSLRRRS